ncbi:MAG: haloacid dehalogenase [Chloroflexota bacterium]|nr:haloacid dehalogenase [Chloroflexota bacterium]
MERGGMAELREIARAAASRLEAKNEARERALAASRTITRQCANAIRSTHRGEWQQAQGALDEVGVRLEELRGMLVGFPEVYWAGYLQDALKEYAEGRITLALVQHGPVPGFEALGVEVAPYLNGLGEAVGELRRRALDIIRHGEAQEAEDLLDAMEEIYNILITVDYPDALTGGLRRTTDNARGILERTRGDITFALRQQRLEEALRRAGG